MGQQEKGSFAALDPELKKIQSSVSEGSLGARED